MRFPPETPVVALVGAVGYAFVDPDTRNKYGVIPTVLGAFAVNLVGFVIFYAATYRRRPS